MKYLCKSYLYIIFSIAMLNMPVWADDTEVFASEQSATPPNLLFVIDNSASMQTAVPGDTLGRNRMEVLQATFKDMLDNMDPEIEVGVSRYSGGGATTRGISFPVSPLTDDAPTILTSNLISAVTLPAGVTVADDADHDAMFDLDDDNLPNPSLTVMTVKDYLKEVVDSWTPSGDTPIVGQMTEAVKYFKGESTIYGSAAPSHEWSAHSSTYTGYMFAKSALDSGGTVNCPNLTDCRHSYIPDSCSLVSSPMNFNQWSVSDCLASGSCASCTENTSTTTSASTKVICDSNTNTSCGDNCVLVPNADPNEPRYRCDSPTTRTTTNYTCPNYYQCDTAPSARWTSFIDMQYNTPIDNECQSNFVVLLSDGEPQGPTSAMESHQATAKSTLGLTGDCADIPGSDDALNSLSNGKCGPEITNYLATTDFADGTINADLDGDQNIKTYTIGYGLAANSPGENYLKLLASNGQGEYYAADSAATLADAFNNLLEDIGNDGQSSLTSPAYSINSNNLLAHNAEIFVPIAAHSSDGPRWFGNLKKYPLVNGNIVDSAGVSVINDKGELLAEAEDAWATTANEVGGVAGKLDPATRKLYTDVGSGMTMTPLAANNASVTTTMLSVPTAQYRQQILDYIRGYDITTANTQPCIDPDSALITDTGHCTARLALGDILHSKPVVVSYDDSDVSKRAIYFGTNEGFLHGVNASTGAENFAYMPRSLLTNIDRLFRNATGEEHPYGVDGEITIWRHDENKDGKIKASDGDYVYLYFGLRRGGTDYFALNVTDPVSPSILWKKGQSDGGAYAEFGQTWSKPALAKIRYKDASDNIQTKVVMVVGAGYDPTLDEESRVLRSKDINNKELHTQGRGIFILDALNGDIIKDFRHDNHVTLNYGVPGNIRLLDMDGDKYLDRLYFSDTGGNLWRVDLFANTTSLLSLDSAKLTRLASLGEDAYGAALDTRKFYHEPDVAIFKQAGVATLTVSVGSGYHARPLNTDIQDGIFVVKDPNVYNVPPSGFSTIQRSNLKDANASSSDPTLTYDGWYAYLSGTGEKVLSSPITFLNKVIFTSFTPAQASRTINNNNSCTIMGDHATRFYAMDLLTGDAVLDLDKDGSVETSVAVPFRYIAGSPHIGFREPSCTDGVCEQHIDLKVGLAQPVISSEDITTPAASVAESLDIESFMPKTFWLDQD